MEIAIRQHSISNKGELKAVLAEEWQNIDYAYCSKLMKSIPARFQAIKDHKVFATKY